MEKLLTVLLNIVQDGVFLLYVTNPSSKECGKNTHLLPLHVNFKVGSSIG